MARQEQDREDLFAEATALVERAEFQAPGFVEPLVVGFRRDDSLSLYVHGEQVYHFNSLGQLRRAFVDGLIYKAQRRGLASLRRQRTGQRLELARHDLSPIETEAFLNNLESCLAPLRAALAHGHCQVQRQSPVDRNVLGKLSDCLGRWQSRIEIADSPKSC